MRPIVEYVTDPGPKNRVYDADGAYRPDTITIPHQANRFRGAYETTFHHHRFNADHNVRIETPNGSVVIDPDDLLVFVAEYIRRRLESDVARADHRTLLEWGIKR